MHEVGEGGDTKMLTGIDNIIFSSFLFSKSLAEHISKIVKNKKR